MLMNTRTLSTADQNCSKENPNQSGPPDFVEIAVPNVFEEEKLRLMFPDRGGHSKFFKSQKYKIRYVLSREGVPVAQVVRDFGAMK